MSEALRRLQEKIGVTADGGFGPNTARAIAKHYDFSVLRGAHLLGQTAHESGSFYFTEENLNYSAESIVRVWPSRFADLESAEPFARNPEALADAVYGDRMGNDGEGWRWRGRGFLQLTGRSNYEAFAEDMNLPEVLDNPDCVCTEYAMETAIWFFEKNGLFEIADLGILEDVIERITKRVNGGTHGLDDRIKKTQQIYGWLSG